MNVITFPVELLHEMVQCCMTKLAINSSVNKINHFLVFSESKQHTLSTNCNIDDEINLIYDNTNQ